MSTTTTATTELEDYKLLRFFHQANKEKEIYYCKDISFCHAKKRTWGKTTVRDQGYKFARRDDARRAANGACWKSLVEEGYKWEVVEVREVRVTTQTFLEETVATNASPLIALARQSE